MWYLLKVDALVTAFVFSVAGLTILALFVWNKAKAYARQNASGNAIALSVNARKFNPVSRLTTFVKI